MGHNKPTITGEHINQIKILINENPDWNRTVLSKKLCELWDWRSPVGQAKDISCYCSRLTGHKEGISSQPPPDG